MRTSMKKTITFLKSKINFITACMLYIITCIFLYYVQYKLYGGAVDTGLVYVVALPPIYFILWFINSENEGKSEKENVKWKKILNIVLILALFGFALYIIYNNPYELRAYEIISLLAVGVLIDLVKKIKPEIDIKKIIPNFVSAAFGVVIITTVLYITILNPCTLQKAEEMLKKSNYENILFTCNCNILIFSAVNGIDSDRFNGDEEALGLYLFKAERDNKQYGVIVSIVNGTYADFDLQNNNEAVKYMMENKIRYH